MTVVFGDGSHLFSIGIDGADLRQLVSDGLWTDPSWSADGTSLVAVEEDGPSSLALIDATSEEITVIATLAHLTATGPRLSPDGKLVIFSAVDNELGGDALADLYVVRSDGSGELRNLTESPGVSESAPSWSPDGTTIAYGLSEARGTERSIATRSFNGDLQQLLLGPDRKPVA
jgi:Tol biopolymer transport system component